MNIRSKTTAGISQVLLAIKCNAIEIEDGQEIIAALLDAQSLSLKTDQYRLQRGLHNDIVSTPRRTLTGDFYRDHQAFRDALDTSDDSNRLHAARFTNGDFAHVAIS